MKYFCVKTNVNFIYGGYLRFYMKYFYSLLIIPLLFIPAFAQENSETLPTDKGTLNVKLSYEDIAPGTQTRLNIDFINPQTKKIQEHIDYRMSVTKDGETIFGPIPLTHTSVGSVKIPVEFNEEGSYSIDFEIEGILFQPIPMEKVSFNVIAGQANAQPPIPVNDGSEKPDGGGCLIATAAYGSEMAPQIQQLRELRDNTIMSTKSGSAFMSGFNQVYYLFSPTVADLEREQPVFKEFVKISLTPMLASLSLLDNVDIDTEQEMLGYGIGVIAMNIGMYVGLPVFGILRLYQFKRK